MFFPLSNGLVLLNSPLRLPPQLNGGSVVKNPPAVQEMWVQSLGWEDPLEKGMANPLHYSHLGNPLDRGAWRATVHGVTRADCDLVTKPPTPNWIVTIC